MPAGSRPVSVRFRLCAALACAAFLLAVPGDRLRPRRLRLTHAPHRQLVPPVVPESSVIVTRAGRRAPLLAIDADAPRFPASTTKLMTLYILFEEMRAGRLHKGDTIAISPHADGKPPSTLVVPSHRITVGNAILAIILRSANNIATAVAERVAGSEDGFAVRMNATARRLGMRDSSFHNPSGLSGADNGGGGDNVTTAADLARLAAALQRDFPDFMPLFKLATVDIDGARLVNHNRLLTRYPEFTGMKTGYFRAAGSNIVATLDGKKGDRTTIVVLGSRSSAQRDARVVQLACQYVPSFRRAEARACGAPTP